MSFMGIFRSKNRKNRVIYDSKPVSPNEEDICSCAPEPAEAPEACEEQCQCCEAESCCEEVCGEDNGPGDCECDSGTDD